MKYGPAGKNGSAGGGQKGQSGKGKPGGKHGKKPTVPEIGLYSSRMTFIHPYTGEEVFLHREPEGRAFDLMDAEDPDW